MDRTLSWNADTQACNPYLVHKNGSCYDLKQLFSTEASITLANGQVLWHGVHCMLAQMLCMHRNKDSSWSEQVIKDGHLTAAASRYCSGE